MVQNQAMSRCGKRTLFSRLAISSLLSEGRGSGKSTLLGLLGALTSPCEGHVTLDGKDVWSHSESELANFRATEIGFIFQFASLLPNLRAIDNVALPALLSGHLEIDSA